MPEANKVMIQMHAVMGEWERDQISARTKTALVAAKARGVNLGVAGALNLKRHIEERQAAADAFAGRLSGVVRGFRTLACPTRQMVAKLNASGLKTRWRVVTGAVAAHVEASALDQCPPKAPPPAKDTQDGSCSFSRTNFAISGGRHAFANRFPNGVNRA